MAEAIAEATDTKKKAISEATAGKQSQQQQKNNRWAIIEEQEKQEILALVGKKEKSLDERMMVDKMRALWRTIKGNSRAHVIVTQKRPPEGRFERALAITPKSPIGIAILDMGAGIDRAKEIIDASLDPFDTRKQLNEQQAKEAQDIYTNIQDLALKMLDSLKSLEQIGVLGQKRSSKNVQQKNTEAVIDGPIVEAAAENKNEVTEQKDLKGKKI